MQSSRSDEAFQRSAGGAAVNDRLGGGPAGGEWWCRVPRWAPHAGSVKVAGLLLEPEQDGLFSARLEVAAGTEYAYSLDAGRRCPTRARAGSPRPARAVARPRHRRIQLERETGPLALDELGDLRAPRRDIHAARARSPRRSARLDELARARRDSGRADAGRDVPGRARLGLRRRAHLGAAQAYGGPGGPRAVRRRRACAPGWA